MHVEIIYPNGNMSRVVGPENGELPKTKPITADPAFRRANEEKRDIEEKAGHSRLKARESGGRGMMKSWPCTRFMFIRIPFSVVPP